MQKFSFLVEESKRSNFTPINKKFLIPELLDKEDFYKPFKNNKIYSNQSNKKNDDLFEYKTSVTQSSNRTTNYSSNLPRKSNNDSYFNNKCNFLFNQVSESPKNQTTLNLTDNFRDFTIQSNNSKDDFKEKYNDLKLNFKSKNDNNSKAITGKFSNINNIRSNYNGLANYKEIDVKYGIIERIKYVYKGKLFPKEKNHFNSDYLSNITPTSKFSKKNLELLFPKKENFLFSNLNKNNNITCTTNKCLTLNSRKLLIILEKIPNEIFNKIKKTLPDFLHKDALKDNYLDRTENHKKIEKMKDKLNKYFK